MCVCVRSWHIVLCAPVQIKFGSELPSLGNRSTICFCFFPAESELVKRKKTIKVITVRVLETSCVHCHSTSVCVCVCAHVKYTHSFWVSTSVTCISQGFRCWGVWCHLLRSCGGKASLSSASSLLFNRLNLRVTMPAPKHPYSLIDLYIHIYRLYIDTYLIYLSVYGGETYMEKQKLMYKNSVSCSLTNCSGSSSL